MSERWPGGIVRATPVTPTGPLQNGTAPGMWTLDQADYWIKQGLWPTAGNFLAVEDVFSTYLYTGNGSTQTITNGINLSGQGGLVWVKARGDLSPLGLTGSHTLYDTNRGTSNALRTNGTFASASISGVTAFNSNGFDLGTNGVNNASGYTYVSWTFREAPKFFDVVTYSGNSVGLRQISHSLGVEPGCIIVKETNNSDNWWVYHRGTGTGNTLNLNTTAAVDPNTLFSAVSSTTFTPGSSTIPTGLNVSGSNYVAYLFAHDTTSDGIIQCGSFTAGVSTGTASVTLGWEPQWLLIKGSNATAVSDAGGYWSIMDNMRGMDAANNAVQLQAQSSAAESTNSQQIRINSTGFTAGNMAGSSQYIYIAIRRGPMRTPTLGTTVFSPIASTASNGTQQTTNFPVDFQMFKNRAAVDAVYVLDRLRGVSTTPANTSDRQLYTNGTFPEQSSSGGSYYWNNTGFGTPQNMGSVGTVYWSFRRAPSFFDEVCYTGTGSATTINHNLGVAPELTIFKSRSGTAAWYVLYDANASNAKYATLNTTDAGATATYGSGNAWSGQPTATTLSLGSFGDINGSGSTYVAYLFASCSGVSKVGSYTGTGTTQTINCGFTTGARFVLIKRTDSTGDWYVWDSARGIVAGNDPYLLLNSAAAEVTNTDYIDTDNSGFQISSTAPAGINANGGSYIFLAIS